jgi:hypothetical protein
MTLALYCTPLIFTTVFLFPFFFSYFFIFLFFYFIEFIVQPVCLVSSSLLNSKFSVQARPTWSFDFCWLRAPSTFHFAQSYVKQKRTFRRQVLCHTMLHTFEHQLVSYSEYRYCQYDWEASFITLIFNIDRI